MMKKKLLQSASTLPPPSADALTAFSRKRSQMAAQASETLFKRADLEKLIGRHNKELANDNNRNFARFMESLFSEYNPDVFVETVLWVFRAYRSHGFQTPYWAANLNIWVDLLKSELPEADFVQLYPFYHWMIVNIPVFTKLTDPEGVA